MRPLGIATWILAAMALFILWGAARADFSLLPESAKSSLDRCYRRCEKNNPPIPSPQPTYSPEPQPCEVFSSAVVKDFEDGQARLLCFDVSGDGPAIVTVASQNHGNASCADAESTPRRPAARHTTRTARRSAAHCCARRDAGTSGRTCSVPSNLPGCHTYTFTVTK